MMTGSCEDPTGLQPGRAPSDDDYDSRLPGDPYSAGSPCSLDADGWVDRTAEVSAGFTAAPTHSDAYARPHLFGVAARRLPNQLRIGDRGSIHADQVYSCLAKNPFGDAG